MKNVEKLTLTATTACHALVHMLELTYGVVLIGISLEFNATLLVMGVLANIFGFAFGVMSLPSGVLADRISERKLLASCCAAMAVSAVAIGLAPDIYVLGAALLTLGLAMGIFHPVAATFIARTVTRRGLGFGYLGIGGNLGLALGPILAGAMASLFSWRASYFVLAIPAIILAIIFLTANPNQAAKPRATATTEDTPANKPSLRPVLPILILIFTAQALNGLIYRGLVTFLPLHLSQQVKFSFLNMDAVMIAGSFTTIALIFGVGGQFIGGHLSERWRREKLVFFIALVGLPLLLAVGNSTGLLLIAMTTSLAFFHFMGQPVYNSLVADYTPAGWHGRMYGIYFFCNFGIGSFSASILGYITDKMGTGWVFTVSSDFGLLTLVCTILLMKAAKKRTRDHRIDSDR